MPKTVAPSPARVAERHARVPTTTGRRLIAAMATEALSMIRLMIISATSFSTATWSAATAAIFQASWSSRFSVALDGWTFTGCSFMRFLQWMRRGSAHPKLNGVSEPRSYAR